MGKPIDPEKVAIYIRWSTDEQTDGTTLEVQRDACLFYARSQGWIVPEERIFVDDGYSGGTLDRPGMTRIRELVQAGKIECVIVYKIDRLSRNIVDATSLVLSEWEGKCYLKCVSEPVDTTTDLGRMIFSILATFADFERSQIRSRTFTGRVKRAAEGRHPGFRLPLGYKHGSTPGEILIDEAEAAIVRRIFQLYASGYGIKKIASILNGEGAPTKLGNKWAVRSIKVILRNPRYIGEWSFGTTQKNKADNGEGPRRIPTEAPLATAKRPDLAIIPVELWEQCQAILDDVAERLRQTSGRAISSEHLLSGLVRCRCGHTMTAETQRRAFRCVGQLQKGLSCDCGLISEKVLNQIVEDFILKLQHPHIANKVREAAESEMNRTIASIRALIASTEKRLAALDNELQRVRRDYRSGKLDVDTFNELRKDIEKEQQEQKNLINRYQAELENIEKSLSSSQQVIQAVKAATQWSSYTLAEKKLLLRQLIDHIVVYRKRHTKEPLQVKFVVRGLDPSIVAEIQEMATETPAD